MKRANFVLTTNFLWKPHAMHVAYNICRIWRQMYWNVFVLTLTSPPTLMSQQYRSNTSFHCDSQMAVSLFNFIADIISAAITELAGAWICIRGGWVRTTWFFQPVLLICTAQSSCSASRPSFSQTIPFPHPITPPPLLHPPNPLVKLSSVVSAASIAFSPESLSAKTLYLTLI